MIRIYLDWDIISNLKKDEFIDIFNFIKKNKNNFLIPFSPTHFNDLMKSYRPDNELFFQDIDTLEFLSDNHLLNWENDRTMPLLCTPKEFFKNVKENNDPIELLDFEKLLKDLDNYFDEFDIGKVSGFIKENLMSIPTGIEINEGNEKLLQKMFPGINSQSNMWELITNMQPFLKKLLKDREYYKDYRRSLRGTGPEIDKNHGNWDESIVSEKLSSFLNQQKTDMTFHQYIKEALSHQKKPYTRKDFFTTAYLMLDMIGYKSDKLPKRTDSMQNIYNDSEHAFYSAHCDFFVAKDSKLVSKTKVLFKEFNISTTVLTPDNFITSIEPVIHKADRDDSNFVNDIANCFKCGNIVENYTENGVKIIIAKTHQYFLNFFNYIIFHSFPSEKKICFTFKRICSNYSDFIYYTEVEKLIQRTVSFIGQGHHDVATLTNKFVHKKECECITWHFEDGKIMLNQDKEGIMPKLSLILDYEIAEYRE